MRVFTAKSMTRLLGSFLAKLGLVGWAITNTGHFEVSSSPAGHYMLT